VKVDGEFQIDWDAYASQYDLLADLNPSYRENIETVREIIADLALPSNPAICDLGAGTGNFICALSRDLPGAQFVHLDADSEMNRIAGAKYAKIAAGNVTIQTDSVFEAEFPSQSFDLILCVNALYSMNPQREVLCRINRWLKPGGFFVVIDFGRRAKIFDWGRYILGNMLREKGILESVKIIRSGWESLRQNRRGSKGQLEGLYWLHSTEEFGRALSEAGFLVDELTTCYRGYCDLAVCRLAGLDVRSSP